MKFVQFTDVNSGKKLLLNPAMIEAIVAEGDGTRLFTMGEGSQSSYVVTDTFDSIVNKFHRLGWMEYM